MRSLAFGSALLIATTLLPTAFAADKDPFKAPLGLKPVPVPEDNPLTPEKVELGKQLTYGLMGRDGYDAPPRHRPDPRRVLG
jgi:hypothetical protein